jgi:long-chain acyl-CoA synthetase
MNLANLVDEHAGDRPALHDGDIWIDWSEVRVRARAVARAIAGLGVGPGDRVALAWPTSADFVVAYLATLASGAVAVPLNPASPQAELEREFDFVEPSAVICGGISAEAIATICEGRGERDRLVTPGGLSGSTDWIELIASATDGRGDTKLGATEREDSDPAVMLFTSGTAGTPRAAVLSHGNLVANLRQMLAVPGTLLGGDDIGLAAVPFFHVFGLNVVLGLTLATGARLVCEERFDPQASLDLVVRREVTVIAGAPPMFADWAALDRADARSFQKVRLVLSGAAALDREIEEGFSSRFGLSLRQGYGLTEASPAVATSVGLPAPATGSVGRPLPGLSVKLVDESGEDALIDDPGEIWVRGPNVFSGYWHDESATREVLDQAGWLHTGDVGVLDSEGELHVVDRLKDLVIVSGFNVVPSEVEQVVRRVDGVKEAVVVGMPDPRTGESVEALVVKEPGSAVTAPEVVAFCAAHLAHYKVPTKVLFVDSLPHGATGKALRRFARELG